jgi:HK97 family phage major capsid protein
MPKSARAIVGEYQSILEQADREGREPTSDEWGKVEALVDLAHDRHNVEKNIKRLGRELGAPTKFAGDNDFSALSGSFGGGPGDIFIESQQYKAVRYPDSRPQTWTTGPVEVTSGAPGLELKGTLLESGTGGPGGGLVPPQYQPGVVSKLFEPLGVADLFGTSQTTGSQMRYVVEGTATSGAAGVAEGAAKPESTLVMSEVVEPIRKIATWLPVSDEFLEDAPAVQQHINGRLSLFVRLEEERQLLRGAGAGSNELVGIFGRSGINTYTKLAADDNAVALAKVIANTAGSAFLEPDGIIMHPANWLTTRLLRDGTGGTIGQFYGGGPFSAAYGGGAADVGMFGQTLWNKRVVLSNYVGPGTALVGNFGQGAHLWRRGGVSVEASNSHDQFFRLNLTAIRAESRLGLGLYRPVSMTEVRGLT